MSALDTHLFCASSVRPNGTADVSLKLEPEARDFKMGWELTRPRHLAPFDQGFLALCLSAALSQFNECLAQGVQVRASACKCVQVRAIGTYSLDGASLASLAGLKLCFSAISQDDRREYTDHLEPVLPCTYYIFVS